MARLCFLVVFVGLLMPPFGRAQVTGTFSLEKVAFAPGEPVFLTLTLRNEGKDVAEVQTAGDPFSFCSGYTIHISGDAAPEPACFEGAGGSCMSGAISLAPGASRSERLLLNYKSNALGDLRAPVGVPGDYTVEASRKIAYAPVAGSRIYTAPDRGEVRQTFHLRVDPALELSPTIYAPYMQQLDSKEDTVRREAARTLATLAPAALEPLLLTFATSKDPALQEFAPLALANLGTKASLAALAQMFRDSQPGTYESWMAAEKLGQTHDPAWLPLLLEVADQHGGMYLANAAESGGDVAIPALLARLHSQDPGVRDAAIYAFGSTGSRVAVPVLISLLGGQGDRNTAIYANLALMRLTHFYAEQGVDGDAIPSWQGRWQRWWLASGASATIYKPGACAEDVKLP